MALPWKTGAVEQPWRYVQCARSSVQAETASLVEKAEDAVAGSSLDSRNVLTFQQAIQRLQVGFGEPTSSIDGGFVSLLF